MIIAGNWKMNLLSEASKGLAQAIARHAEGLRKTECWLAPPFSTLHLVVGCTHSNLKVGAQNVHWANSGAFTGEVSAPMLLDLGCTFALVGHSERRQFFGETDATVRQRAASGLNSGLDVIVCVGELLEERESGNTEAVLRRQLTEGIDPNWSSHPTGRLIVAYEPVWAIGTGKVASVLEIAHAHAFIVATLAELGCKTPPPVLYGGSVKPENFEEISGIQHVGGALVGGASLEAKSFCALLDIAETR